MSSPVRGRSMRVTRTGGSIPRPDDLGFRRASIDPGEWSKLRRHDSAAVRPAMTEGVQRGNRAAYGSVLLMLAVAVGMTVLLAATANELTGSRSLGGTTTGLWAPGDAIAFR